MAFLPPIELPDLCDLYPPWLDSVFRKHDNVVDEEAAIAAAECELSQRSKAVFHVYSDFTPIGRLNDGTDNMDEDEREEEEEGEPGDDEYESGGEGDMDDMDAEDYYLDEATGGLETGISATITLPLPSVATTTPNVDTVSETPSQQPSTGDSTAPGNTEEHPATEEIGSDN